MIQIEQIVSLATEVDLASPERRKLLLVGLPARIRESLPTFQRPGDQLRSDILELAAIGTIDGVERPALTIWLENAANLLEPRAVASTFRHWARGPLAMQTAGYPSKWRKRRLLVVLLIGVVVAATVIGITVLLFQSQKSTQTRHAAPATLGYDAGVGSKSIQRVPSPSLEDAAAPKGGLGDATPPETLEPPALRIRLFRHIDGNDVSVPINSALPLGSRLRFEVTTEVGAHLYIVHFGGSENRSNLLYPIEEDLPLPEGATVRLPSPRPGQASYYRLGPPKGEDIVVVLWSKGRTNNVKAFLNKTKGADSRKHAENMLALLGSQMGTLHVEAYSTSPEESAYRFANSGEVSLMFSYFTVDN